MKFISNSFCENSFNDLLDVLTDVTVAETRADACKVVFLVQLPYLPMNPWPELKQDHQDECRGQGSVFFVMKAETYFQKLMFQGIYPH